MNCAQAHPQIYNYLEDLLPEAEREEIRDHIAGCTLCAGHIVKQSHFVTDLQRLNFLLPPFEPEQLLQEAIDLKAENYKAQRSKFLLGVIAVGVASFIVYAGYATWKYGIHPRIEALQKRQAEEERKKKEAAEKGKEIYLATLIAINKRLGGEATLVLSAGEPEEEPSAEGNVKVLFPERTDKESERS